MRATLSEMIALARDALSAPMRPIRNFASAPRCAAANGKLYAGCNVENAAYPQGTCAEAAAIAAMVADGERRIAEVARGRRRRRPCCTPCGGCRQRLREFAADATPIHLCGPEGVRRTVTLGELLPLASGPTICAPEGRVMTPNVDAMRRRHPRPRAGLCAARRHRARLGPRCVSPIRSQSRRRDLLCAICRAFPRRVSPAMPAG